MQSPKSVRRPKASSRFRWQNELRERQCHAKSGIAQATARRPRLLCAIFQDCVALTKDTVMKVCALPGAAGLTGASQVKTSKARLP